MSTLGLPSARPFHTAYATYAAQQRQGTRTVQADAYAVLHDPITGRIAAAVADARDAGSARGPRATQYP